MRLIEVEFPEDYCERVQKYAELAEAIHWRISDPDSAGRCVLRAVFESGATQEIMDALQSLFESEKDWRIIVLPVEATAPKLEEKYVDREKRRKTSASREEIYQDTAGGAALTSDFLVLTVLSTIVAAIGLSTSNVAVVIGAMVIAPLLGPVVAFAFAAAIGDLALLLRASRTALAGLGLGALVAGAIGAIFPVDFASPELNARTALGLDSIALALASGGAAALSIAAGLPAALVGVMVAVALLPPSAAAGMFLGAGDIDNAVRAALLLTVNVVCVNLAALVIFAYKGVRPRTWIEKISAARATKVNAGVLVFLLAALTIAILLFQSGQ
ncbi:MAG: TIGR00341 family protein [Pseudomonadota bacterium]